MNLLAFGHRGAAGHAPENTLASIRKALDLGADWIEVDVQNVEDELIVFHDSELNRRTNGSGLVSDHTLAEIRALDAGRGERVPLLREVLDLIDYRCGVNIELKGSETALKTVETVETCIRETGWQSDQFLISSFDLDQLAEVRARSDTLHIAPLFIRLPKNYWVQVAVLKPAAIHLRDNSVRRETVEDIHGRGMKVHVYTVNRMDRILKLKRMGVDGIFSDYPDRVIKAREMG